jgi:hypothetical protein
VIMIASTPSLNASNLPLPICSCAPFVLTSKSVVCTLPCLVTTGEKLVFN